MIEDMQSTFFFAQLAMAVGAVIALSSLVVDVPGAVDGRRGLETLIGSAGLYVIGLSAFMPVKRFGLDAVLDVLSIPTGLTISYAIAGVVVPVAWTVITVWRSVMRRRGRR